MKLRFPLVPTLVVAFAVATMIGLGVWQLQRAKWKEGLLAAYAAAADKPEIAFPTMPLTGEPPLFRRAHGICLKVVSWDSLAGENRQGKVGYSHLARCSTGAEGPGMTVDAGWSSGPQANLGWSGGKVSGVIAPDRKQRMRLVSDVGLGGLEASAPPSTESIPNNHRSYAVQWFAFALIASVIYVLALAKRLKAEQPR